jgi:hypothetical protein
VGVVLSGVLTPSSSAAAASSEECGGGGMASGAGAFSGSAYDFDWRVSKRTYNMEFPFD